MSVEAETAATLREARARLARPDMTSKVDLRDYVPQGSAAWNEFVRIRGETPGHNVRRATMIRWLDEAAGQLDGAVLHAANDEGAQAPPLASVPEVTIETETAAEQIEPPSPRDLHRAGDRQGLSDALPPRLDTSQIERELVERAAATLDGDDLAMARWSGLGSIDNGLEDWYYGPEIDEVAREERTNLNAAQREERARRWAEQRAREGAQAPGSLGPTPPTPTAAASTPTPPPTPASGGAPLRELTEAGIELAREFLAHLHENPEADRTPPDKLFRDERYSRVFDNNVRVEPRSFGTRREAGAYLAPLLAPIRHRIIDHAGVWSWLGMYYFEQIVRVKDGRVQLHTDESVLFLGGRLQQRRYRHYLWLSWRIYEQHGERASFLLNQPSTTRGDLVEAIGGYARIFNSQGLVPLILRLYTDGEKTRVGFSAKTGRPGNIRRLPAALDQLELTYDVYGMEPDALLDILPPAFREWDAKSA